MSCARMLRLLTLIALVAAVLAQSNQPDPKEVKAVMNKAIDYLKSAQNKDGSFAPKLGGPGVSCLVVAGLVRHSVSAEEPMVAKALKYIESMAKKNGGIYDKGLANYTTSVAVMALQEANTKGQYDKILKDAVAFLKKVQHLEPESSGEKVEYGGFGYDEGSPPDASNTNYTVEALLAAGIPKDDPAIQKALKFLSRCQNLPKEFNDQPFAKKASADDLG